MVVEGGCRCGAVRYRATGEPQHVAICHCKDCRRSAGAPMVAWAMFSNESVTVEGELTDYVSSPGVTRQFCGQCGTGLFYHNPEIFPDAVDIQTGTLDDAEALPPTAHIQMADAAAWMHTVDALPKFDRFPEPG